MKNKKTKILFICILKASVIQKDLELLKKHFDVRVVDFILSRKNLKGTLKTLKSIPSMIMGVIWADVTTDADFALVSRLGVFAGAKNHQELKT